MCTPYQYIPLQAAPPCGCGTPYYSPNYAPYQQPCDVSLSPCGVKTDSQYVIYHLFNNELSTLTNLGITNGATLESILTAIDPYIGQLKFTNTNLTYLRTKYTIGNLQQFAVAINTELSSLNDAIGDVSAPASTGRWLGNVSSDPGSSVDGDYWYNTSIPAIKMKVGGGIVKQLVTL